MSTQGLTVCLIVRDERENLEELLPVVVAGCDDVIVVDTGSADGSAERARELGARVFEDPWREDFSRARNRGLDEVRTSHVLWLDADDRITAADLARLRTECLRAGNVAVLALLVNESADPAGVTSCWQLRAFPARAEHRFRGRVHEQVIESVRATNTPTTRLDVTIRHTGYVRPEDVLRKARRNLELLHREAADGRDDVSVLYHWVKAASRCGELDEAADVARRLVDDPPTGTPDEVRQSAAITLGRVEFQRGRRDEAVRVLRDAVGRVPDDPLARFFLGDVLRRSGDLEGALRELEVARVAPIRTGTLPLPVAGLRRAVRLQLGEVLETLGRPAEAAAVYRESLDDRSDDPPVRIGLARSLLAAGLPAEAEKIVATLEGAPEGETLLIRGLLAFECGRDEEAARCFGQAAERVPRAWAAPLHLGHLALRSGRVEEARQHYARALRLSDAPEVRVGLAAAELEAGQTIAALDLLAAAVEACGSRPLPRGTEALSGEALLRIGRPREAAEAFEKHLRRHGADPRILARIADCYRALGVPRAARLGYEEALRLSPGLPEAVRGLEALSVPS